MAARSPIMRAVVKAAERGVTVVGVCNGFQVLTEAGLLPGALMRNGGIKFVCRDVALTVENSQSAFTSRYDAGEQVTFPVAHHDGNYRSEEHTSELHSLMRTSYAVFCLKKTHNQQDNNTTTSH